MDGEVLLLLRFGGYVLNIFLLTFVALRDKRHLHLLTLAVFFAVVAAAVLLRYLGRFDSYLTILDYALTPLLYLNAGLILYVLLRPPQK